MKFSIFNLPEPVRMAWPGGSTSVKAGFQFSVNVLIFKLINFDLIRNCKLEIVNYSEGVL